MPDAACDPHIQSCCFTGHRHIPSNELSHLTKRLEKAIVRLAREEGCLHFLAGGALGFDTLAAETVLSLRDKEGSPLPLRLTMLLPCRDQTKHWRAQDIARYESVLRRADEVVCLSEHYTRGCMHTRNRALVDRSHFCLCYLTDATQGGTAYTVRYAAKSRLSIENLAKSPAPIESPEEPQFSLLID